MVTTAYDRVRESETSSGRFAIWVSRFPLIAATVIFTAISFRFIADPVQAAAARGIAFSSPVGITVGRVALGGFPLAFAIITLCCLISRPRVLAGIYMVLTVVGVLLVVRTAGMIVDGSVKESVPVVIPEVVLLVISLVALNVELRRRKQEMRSLSAT